MSGERGYRTTCKRQTTRGYVLLLVLGALALVVSIALGIAGWIRDRTQAESRALRATEQRLQLQGQVAAALTKIRLDQLWIPRVVKGEQLPDGYQIWVPRPEPYRWGLQGRFLNVYVHPVTWYPDVNLLDAAAMSRLMQSLGTPADQAEAFSARLMAKRQLLAARGGFNSFGLLNSLWDDEPSAWLGWNGTASPPGVLWNLSWGTRSLVTDPNHTPLSAYRAIYNASPSKLRELELARGRAPVSKTKEREIMGEPVPELQTSRANSPGVSAYRVRLMIVPILGDGDASGGPLIAADVSINGTQALLNSSLVFYPR